MAKVTGQSVTETRVVLKTQLELDEIEVRALDGIFGYDVEKFLEVFYRTMGAAYVKPFEAGVRSLHATIRRELAGPLAAVTEARQKLDHSRRLYAQAVADAQKTEPPKKPTVRA